MSDVSLLGTGQCAHCPHAVVGARTAHTQTMRIRSDRTLRLCDWWCQVPLCVECTAHVGIEQEVVQDHNGKDHAGYNGPVVGFRLGEGHHTVGQTDDLDDHRPSEGPARKPPQFPGEEERQMPHTRKTPAGTPAMALTTAPLIVYPLTESSLNYSQPRWPPTKPAHAG